MEKTSEDGFGGARRLEIVETGRRRRWDDETKKRIVEEAFEKESPIARRHGIAPTQIYEWRKRFFPRVPLSGSPNFAPVVVARAEPAMPSNGRMEIACSNGRRITVDRDVDVDALPKVVAGLER